MSAEGDPRIQDIRIIPDVTPSSVGERVDYSPLRLVPMPRVSDLLSLGLALMPRVVRRVIEISKDLSILIRNGEIDFREREDQLSLGIRNKIWRVGQGGERVLSEMHRRLRRSTSP